MGSLGPPENYMLDDSYRYGSSYLGPSGHSLSLRTFLVGYPIAHSMSPILHRALRKGLSEPWSLSLLETQDESGFLPALKQADIVGCALTMPHKVALISAVDEVTEESRVIGAINTVFVRRAADDSPRYIGTNTDCIGVKEAFLQNFPNVLSMSVGKPALVIGAGGAGRGAIYALWRWMGASKIYLVNRLESEVRVMVDSLQSAGFSGELVWVSTEAEAEKLEPPTLAVGTVPDLPPKHKGEKLARRIVNTFFARGKGYMLDMCYHPSPRTAMLALAEKAGWKVVYGTEALIYQGLAQQVLWAEQPPERFNLAEARKVIAETMNKDQLEPLGE